MLIDPMTTTDVAHEMGVAYATVRSWVHRGRLAPITPGARPLRFWRDDIEQLRAATMPAEQRDRLHQLTTIWLTQGQQ